MGSGVSLPQLSAQEIGHQVEELGDVYKQYASTFVENGIDGSILSQLNDSELQTLLEDIGISSSVHRKLLGMHLTKLKRPISAISPRPFLSCRHVHPTKPPSIILKRLFSYQGIHLIDPDDLDSIIQKVCHVIQSSRYDGDTIYDCFISYRVASEKEIAEKLYLYFLTKQLNPFLDRMSLKNGELWKDGFLRGLNQSRIFLALVSQAGLHRCKDPSIDHTLDNLLLEYETALTVADSNESFIIMPIYIATITTSGFLKFQDFNDTLYSPILQPEEVQDGSEDDLSSVNRKLTVLETMSADVVELLKSLKAGNKNSKEAAETLFGMAQRTKYALRIVSSGGMEAILDVLDAETTSNDIKDTAAAILSFLAHAITKGSKEEFRIEPFPIENGMKVVVKLLSNGSDIQKQYLIIGLMHFTTYDINIQNHIKSSTELKNLIVKLQETGSEVQRNGCRVILDQCFKQ